MMTTSVVLTSKDNLKTNVRSLSDEDKTAGASVNLSFIDSDSVGDYANTEISLITCSREATEKLASALTVLAEQLNQSLVESKTEKTK
jgi:hypothetical protein